MTEPTLPTPPSEEPKFDPEPLFDRRMLESLVCPQTQGPLTWDPERQELVSKSANLAYPVRDGIPVMLVDEARKLEP